MKYDIYINADIGWPISYEYVRSELSKFEGQDVNVYVSSLGGSLVHALKIRRLFIDHGRVTCHLHGFVASAATILATGAARVLMGRHALYLAHLNSLPVDVEWGYQNAEEIARAIDDLQNTKLDLDKIDSTVAGIYAARGSKTAEEFHAIMAKGLWMNAEEVLALGLADELAEDDSTTFAAASAQGGYSAALRSKIAAYGLPHLPAASHETAAINPHKPTDMPTANVNNENQEGKKPTALAAFFAKLADKLDAFFGLDNLETEAADAAAATEAHAAAAEAPAAPAAANAEAPAAPAAAEPATPAAEPEKPAAANAEAPAAPAAATAETNAAEEPSARLRAAEAEIAALRAQIETMQKQDGATSDPIASAPEEGTENPADRFRRLRAACRRYK